MKMENKSKHKAQQCASIMPLRRQMCIRDRTVRICCEGDAEAEAAQALEALMRAQF